MNFGYLRAQTNNTSFRRFRNHIFGLSVLWRPPHPAMQAASSRRDWLLGLDAVVPSNLLSLFTENGGKTELAPASVNFEPAGLPAGGGMPPKKQAQQEESFAPLDREARRALIDRMMANAPAPGATQSSTPKKKPSTGRASSSSSSQAARQPSSRQPGRKTSARKESSRKDTSARRRPGMQGTARTVTDARRKGDHQAANQERIRTEREKARRSAQRAARRAAELEEEAAERRVRRAMDGAHSPTHSAWPPTGGGGDDHLLSASPSHLSSRSRMDAISEEFNEYAENRRRHAENMRARPRADAALVGARRLHSRHSQPQHAAANALSSAIAEAAARPLPSRRVHGSAPQPLAPPSQGDLLMAAKARRQGGAQAAGARRPMQWELLTPPPNEGTDAPAHAWTHLADGASNHAPSSVGTSAMEAPVAQHAASSDLVLATGLLEPPPPQRSSERSLQRSPERTQRSSRSPQRSPSRLLSVAEEADAQPHSYSEPSLWPEAMAATMAFLPPSPPPPASMMVGRTGVQYVPGTRKVALPGKQDWDALLERAAPRELVRLLHNFGGIDPRFANDCLRQARNLCFERKQAPLVHACIADEIIATMRRYATNESVQTLGCEVLGLLAGGPHGLEQALFDAGALTTCLAACSTIPTSEHILGAALQAVGNICYGGDGGRDARGCARKQQAVFELAVIEAALTGMQDMPTSQWVNEAGCIAIGCLCNGADADGHQRRTYARNAGAIEFALKVARGFPVSQAMPSHKEAYRAAIATIKSIDKADRAYSGPVVAWG